MTVLLTGASGFVGSAVLSDALGRGISIRPVFRNSDQMLDDAKSHAVYVPTLDTETDWSSGLSGVSHVIHCAARVHVMKDRTTNPLSEFRRVNVDGTLNLARQAAQAGVRRFIYISSIKVNGEGSLQGRVYAADDLPAPEDAYGISKAEAESGLLQLAGETGMEVTIIRPPLVYGPGVKGNFLSLMNFVSRGVPLPFGSVTSNRRSLVALDNLVDLILTCVDHPSAGNQIFLVSDGEDLSTAALLQRVGAVFGRPARLVNVPVKLMTSFAALLGKDAVVQRLFGTLQVDMNKTCQLLAWRPPVSVDDGLRKLLGRRL